MFLAMAKRYAAVFKAHRLVYQAILGLRVLQKKKTRPTPRRGRLKRLSRLLSGTGLKPRPESGLDWLIVFEIV